MATMAVLLSSYLPAQAAEMPSGWPWHGVSMDNLSSKPVDLKRYKAILDIDTVRLQLKPAKLAKRRHLIPEQAWQKSLQWLDTMLDTCKKLKIRAIVNLSHFPIDPAYDPNPKIRVAQYTPDFWNDATKLDGVIDRVTKLAAHLKSRGEELAAIDIMSEPAVRDGPRLVAPEKWKPLMERVMGVVRSELPNVWVMISPPPQGRMTSFRNLEAFAESHIIYNAHMYMPSHFAAQGIGNKPLNVRYPGYVRGKHWDAAELRRHMKPLREFQRKYQVPVMVGEFSAVRWADGGEQYIKDLADIFDSYGWSWLYFSATGWHGWNPDYNQHYPGKGGGWRQDYVGDQSVRWQTLRDIFGVKKGTAKP
jgi:aryl-phospho-beta-D-glucosidase BglC (GH1 family)